MKTNRSKRPRNKRTQKMKGGTGARSMGGN